MENANFSNSKDKMFSFIDAVADEKQSAMNDEMRKNTLDYKLKILDDCEGKAKDYCLNKVFSNVYKNALPMNDEYKAAHEKDIERFYDDFMHKKCPNGIEYYVREALKKGSPYAKKVIEAVNELVASDFRKKGLGIDLLTEEDLKFDPDAPENKEKLSEIDITLSSPELADAIKANVINSVKENIINAKKEKEEIKGIEAELAKNIEITSAEAVENELKLRGYGEYKIYKPSLFEAININKLHNIETRFESGEQFNEYLYGTLSVFSSNEATAESADSSLASLDEIAFIESVKEYTMLNMLHSMKFESLTNPDNVEELAYQYSTYKI